MTATIVTGDGATLPITLKKDGATFAIDSGATVQASIITTAHDAVLAGPVAVLEATPGSDWANSLVVVVFSEADTDSLPEGLVAVEIQVDDNGKNTWFPSSRVIIGTVP